MHKVHSTIEKIEDFINQIISWYDSNADDFKEKFKEAVAHVQPIPADTKREVFQPWLNATVDDLCDFFREWYEWYPTTENGLNFIQRFSWLYYRNEKGLSFINSKNGRLMLKYYVELNGRKMDSPESKQLVEQWMEELGEQQDDYIIPKGGYETFNHFFAREIKEDRRPIFGKDDESVVVSPADAIINMINDNLSIDRPLTRHGDPVADKVENLSVRKLLNSSTLSAAFKGGTAVSCILMPNVYHHYHSPVTGCVVESNEDIAGRYFGIDDFPKLINGGNVGYGYNYGIFGHFRRGYLIIKTNNFGYVAMVPVGLNTVGSVVFRDELKEITQLQEPVAIKKGDRIGCFKYGGSLNILLFEKGRFPALRFRQGEIIGRLEKKKNNEKEEEKKLPQFTI